MPCDNLGVLQSGYCNFINNIAVSSYVFVLKSTGSALEESHRETQDHMNIPFIIPFLDIENLLSILFLMLLKCHLMMLKSSSVYQKTNKHMSFRLYESRS
jgi:hypothetical protein